VAFSPGWPEQRRTPTLLRHWLYAEEVFRFGGRLDGNDFSKRGNTSTNSVGFQSKCPKWPIQTNLRCHAKPPTVQSS
jgi:hypothetical protein